MSSTDQATQNCITLKGSATIIAEYLKFGINSILFQRGIYPAETFKNTQQYGLTIFVCSDPKIESFLHTVLSQMEEWLSKNLLDRVSMVITNVYSKETLERWDFKVQAHPSESDTETEDIQTLTTSKDLKRIQQEIRDVMRQIAATVSYLPLLDCICTFDILIYTMNVCELPKSWNETPAAIIPNAQTVELRSFSTGLHKVQTYVNYKKQF